MIRPLFTTYQKEILAFCNTRFGKEWLQDEFGGKIDKEDRVIKVTPSGFHLIKDFQNGRPIIQATFFSKDPYMRKFALMLESLNLADCAGFLSDVQKEIRFKPERLLSHPWASFATLTAYPDTGSGSTTVDGRLNIDPGSTTWAASRSTASAGAAVANEAIQIPCRTYYSGTNYSIYRGAFTFDTSSIPDTDVISSAVFSVYADRGYTYSDADTTSFVITPVTLAANNNLAVGDFNISNYGTSWGSVTLASMTDATYADITLNATGIAGVSKTGITAIGSLNSRDYNNSAPTGDNKIAVKFADNGSNKPKLVVTYAPAAGGSFLLFT
jgi:hypothetical protein